MKNQLPHGPKFEQAWKDWLDYRANERKKKVGPQAHKRQLALLASYPEDEAIAMIDKAIICGWVGLFPLKEGESQNPSLYV